MAKAVIRTGRQGRPRHINTAAEMRAHRRKSFHPRWSRETGEYLVHKINIGAVNELTALLVGFKLARDPEEKEYLFWEIAELLWNQDPDDEKFAKHKWSQAIIRDACRTKYLAIGGAANVGKSYVCAGWAIVNWLCDPANTIVLVTSTDREGAKKRIWGCVKNLLDLVDNPPCKNQYSIGSISYWDGSNKPSSTAGIFLVTADKSKDKDKVGKLIGIHAPRVILVADELSDISPNVQNAATGNLAKNPFFQMIGLSNPSSRFDPFGIFATPKGGWEAVNTETDYEWTTKLGGKFLRIDSELSPNIDDTPSVEYETGRYYPFLPTEESIANDLAVYADNPEEAKKSRNYMRFNRAIFFDSEDDDCFYSESEFIRSGATAGLLQADLLKPVLTAGFDPNASSGGDKAILVFSEVGFDKYGQHSLRFKEMVQILTDVTKKDDPHQLQMAERVKHECVKRGLEVTNLAVDATGAGSGFCDFLQLVWKPGFLRVQFGGAASDKRLKNDSKLTSKDRYANRASELFFVGKSFLMGRQWSGLPPVIIKQMCDRKYETSKGAAGVKLCVEPKRLYKVRVGKSPDEMDAFLVNVEGARTQLLFNPADPIPQEKTVNLPQWLRSRRTHGGYADDKMGFVHGL